MKKLLKWAGIMALVLIVIGIFADGDKPAASNSPASARGKDAAKEVVKVSASELFNSYDANEVATDERLKGKVVVVTGVVQAIDKDAFDTIVIRLRTKNDFMPATMHVLDSEKNKAIALKKGANVAIQCERMSRIIGSPSGGDCTIM